MMNKALQHGCVCNHKQEIALRTQRGKVYMNLFPGAEI